MHSRRRSTRCSPIPTSLATLFGALGGVGAGTVVRIISKRPDQVANFGDSRVMLPTMLIDVRRSQIAAPASGDTVEIDAETFEVIATPVIDSLRLVWTCEAAPPV